MTAKTLKGSAIYLAHTLLHELGHAALFEARLNPERRTVWSRQLRRWHAQAIKLYLAAEVKPHPSSEVWSCEAVADEIASTWLEKSRKRLLPGG